MNFLSSALRLFVVMLFSTLGMSMAFAVPISTSEIIYPQTETAHFARSVDVGFAARAPPLAVSNVAITGGVTVMQDSAVALHGQETVAGLFGFDGNLNATNTGVPSPVVVSKMPKELVRETSSGLKLAADPNKTTTVLGNYGKDMQHVLSELDYPKTLDFGAKKGGFNVLNTPDSLYKNPNQFWNDYNKPFLDDAIKRGDNFPLATKPTGSVLNTFDDVGNITGRSGFGREYDHLTSNGYKYDPTSSSLVKP